ncbi:MAG: hypothetical protein GY835_03795 [bacterium]|nr:hypothetical protein [bacterium]
MRRFCSIMYVFILCNCLPIAIIIAISGHLSENPLLFPFDWLIALVVFAILVHFLLKGQPSTYLRGEGEWCAVLLSSFLLVIGTGLYFAEFGDRFAGPEVVAELDSDQAAVVQNYLYLRRKIGSEECELDILAMEKTLKGVFSQSGSGTLRISEVIAPDGAEWPFSKTLSVYPSEESWHQDGDFMIPNVRKYYINKPELYKHARLKAVCAAPPGLSDVFVVEAYLEMSGYVPDSGNVYVEGEMACFPWRFVSMESEKTKLMFLPKEIEQIVRNASKSSNRFLSGWRALLVLFIPAVSNLAAFIVVSIKNN